MALSPFGNNVTAGIPNVYLGGDYNHNGAVDVADKARLARQRGAGHPADGKNQIDAGDYLVCRAQLGQTAGSGSGGGANAAVPEPATAVLLMLAAARWCLRRGQSRN